jgi:hypothetical protein
MLTALAFFIASFGALLVLEKLVHRRLQELFLLLTGHTESATLLYSLVLLPGVALHEISHAIMALLLGVKVRGFSLRAEKQKSGVIRLGYVEVLRTDSVRTSLIGAAPLIAGLIVLLWIGSSAFQLGVLANAFGDADPTGIARGLGSIFRANDSGLYIYAVFAVANGMMPSKSDMQAWPPVAAVVIAASVLIALLGGESLLTWITPGAIAAFSWLGGVFAMTAVVNTGVTVFLWLLSRLLERVTGRTVTFHK